MSRSRRKSTLPQVFLLLVIMVCFLGGAYYFLAMIPSQVRSMFGEADPALSTLQRFQYAYRIYQQEDCPGDVLKSGGEKTYRRT